MPGKVAVMTATSVANDYFRAWLGGDVEKALSLVADDVVARSPGGEIRGLEAYRRFLQPFATALISSELIDILGDDTHAAAFYVVETPFANDFRGMEYLTVENGRITEAVSVFDRLPAVQARS
jgi:ketosteroid isomerase-like protein